MWSVILGINYPQIFIWYQDKDCYVLFLPRTNPGCHYTLPNYRVSIVTYCTSWYVDLVFDMPIGIFFLFYLVTQVPMIIFWCLFVLFVRSWEILSLSVQFIGSRIHLTHHRLRWVFVTVVVSLEIPVDNPLILYLQNWFSTARVRN